MNPPFHLSPTSICSHLPHFPIESRRELYTYISPRPISAYVPLAAYNILFGLLVVITELKSWPIIKTFQKRVDVYFHLLSVPRGKGFFYCFIGLLAFVASDWNVSRVCTLIVAIVGMLHFLPQIAVEQAHNASDMENATEKPTSGFLGAMGATQGPTSNSDCVASLTSFAMEVVRDNPEAGKALATGTVNFATSNPGLAASAAGVLGGGVPGSTNGDFATSGSMSGVPGS